MKFTKKNLPKSEIEIEIELPAGEWEEFLDFAATDLSKELKIDGFRPGHAPRSVVEQKVGSNHLMEQAAEKAIRKNYVRVILDEKIEAIGQPEISVMKVGLNSPFVFKAKVGVLPKVELGDYKKAAESIKSKKAEEIEPTEKDLNGALEYIRKSRAKSDTNTRDANIRMHANDTNKCEDPNCDYNHVTPLDNAILPELNDEFAKSLGNFENLEALKKSITDGLKMENQEKEKQRWRIEAIKKISEEAKIEMPEALVDAELNKMVEEFKDNVAHLGLEFDKYLEQIKKTEADLRKEWRSKAGERAKIALSLRAIAEAEQIKADEKEVEDEINKYLKYYAENAEQIDINRLKEYTNGVLKNEKVFQYLEQYKK